MKYCKNCNRVHRNEAIYCPVCGSKLLEMERHDIFGEKMDDNERAFNKDEQKHTIEAHEVLSYLSIVFVISPIFGSVISLLGLILSLLKIKENKKNIALAVISLVTLILSILFVCYLFQSGTIERFINEMKEAISSTTTE